MSHIRKTLVFSTYKKYAKYSYSNNFLAFLKTLLEFLIFLYRRVTQHKKRGEGYFGIQVGWTLGYTGIFNHVKQWTSFLTCKAKCNWEYSWDHRRHCDGDIELIQVRVNVNPEGFKRAHFQETCCHCPWKYVKHICLNYTPIINHKTMSWRCYFPIMATTTTNTWLGN